MGTEVPTVKIREFAATFALGAALCCVSALPAAAQADQTKAPDNTKVNKRDRSPAEPTADQARNNVTDRDIMQKIRKSLMDDKVLSTYAHNVKVISQAGKVTLKGPVRSEEEKRTVEQKAVEVAGAGNVTNELSVKPDKKKTTQ
jgi:hyperosmotically inducible periplasmic protein